MLLLRVVEYLFQKHPVKLGGILAAVSDVPSARGGRLLRSTKTSHAIKKSELRMLLAFCTILIKTGNP